MFELSVGTSLIFFEGVNVVDSFCRFILSSARARRLPYHDMKRTLGNGEADDELKTPSKRTKPSNLATPQLSPSAPVQTQNLPSWGLASCADDERLFLRMTFFVSTLIAECLAKPENGCVLEQFTPSKLTGKEYKFGPTRTIASL
jgi:hypothetical protein